MEEYIYLNYHKYYYEIIFYNEKGNCLSTNILNKFIAYLSKLNNDTKCKCLIIRTNINSKSFCSGANIKEINKFVTQDQAIIYFCKISQLLSLLIYSNKIIICDINGISIGGGVGIITCSDYIFATHLSSIKLSELSIGLGPYIIQPLIERKIGYTRFNQLALNSRYFFNAYWAYNNGLYNELFPNYFYLKDRIEEFVNDINEYNYNSLINLKYNSWNQKNINWEKLLIDRAKLTSKIVFQNCIS